MPEKTLDVSDTSKISIDLLISKIKQNDPNIRSIYFSNYYKQKIKKFHRNIEYSESIVSDRIYEIGRSLEENSNVQSIYFAYNEINTHGLYSLLMSIKNKSSITRFACENDSIDYIFIDSILKLLNTLTNLKSLSLAYNKIGEDKYIREKTFNEVANFIESNTTINNLDLSGNQYIGKTFGIDKICEAIEKNKTLTSLNLSNCNIDDNGILKLAKAICNSKISKINLSHNYITASGVNEFVKIIKYKTTITNLDFNHNIFNILNNKEFETLKRNFKQYKIDEKHGLYKSKVKRNNNILITKLLSLKNLRKLDLSYTDIKFSSVAFCTNNLHLQELNLSGNSLKNKVYSLLNRINKFKSLTKLDLSSNNIKESIIYCLEDKLKENKTLEYLDLRNNFILKDNIEKLIEILKNNIIVINLYLDAEDINKNNIEKKDFYLNLNEKSIKYKHKLKMLQLFTPNLNENAKEPNMLFSFKNKTKSKNSNNKIEEPNIKKSKKNIKKQIKKSIKKYLIKNNILSEGKIEKIDTKIYFIKKFFRKKFHRMKRKLKLN